MKSSGFVWKALNGIVILGMTLFPGRVGARSIQNSPTSQPFATDLTQCRTQPVRITLAGEQIIFCAPTTAPFSVVEDDLTDPHAGYAGLDQTEGYGIVNLRATSPSYAPGPNTPVYRTGRVDEYIRSLRDFWASQPDRILSTGPTAELWSEKSTGLQVDYTVDSTPGQLKLRTVEWNVEHNGRLWTFIFTWDTGITNASDWEEASENFSVGNPSTVNQPDTALDLGAASQESQSGQGEVQAAGGPIDVALPSWWDGQICDYDDYLQGAGKPPLQLGGPWHGVYACGTTPPMVDVGVYFFPGAWGALEWECVELVLRFLYLEWAIPPWNGNGNSLKNYYDSTKVDFYPNDGTHPIIPGDVITENGDGSHPNSVGHTVLVTGVTLNGNGDGTIAIMEQNAIPTGHRTLSVDNWVVLPDSYTWGKTIQGWLHAKANQAAGDPDTAFLPATALNGPVNVMALQSDGKIVIGGEFTGYETTPLNHIARFNSDGSRDDSFLPGDGVSMSDLSTPSVNALAVQAADGKILLGGHFDQYDSTNQYNIARLTATGSLDTSFLTGAGVTKTGGPASVNAITVQPSDGKVLIGGDFDHYDIASVNNLARLDTTGAMDASFSASTNGTIYAILVDSTGKILIGGAFSNVNGTPRSGIARLNSDGTLDTAFAPAGIGPAGQAVSSIALQSIAAVEDKILIAGNFSTYNGASRNMIARLKSSDGSLDTTFDPGAGVAGETPYLRSVVPQPDGRILIGGKFTSYRGINLNTLVRLNYDGGIDASFVARLDPATVVNSILLEPDNHILIGGNSTERVSRLLNQIESCYTVTTSSAPPAGGSVTVNTPPNCPGGKYISGSSVSLTPVPNTALEYGFIGWSGDGSGSANPLNVTLTRNKAVTANFLQPPGPVEKISPKDNEPSTYPSSVLLSWKTSERATSYEYCLDPIGSGTCDTDDHPQDWTSTGANTSVTVNNLLPSKTYHWSVRARNQVDTTHGEAAWQFTRDNIPAIPVTVSPAGTITDTRPYFTWNVSPGSTSYHLVVEKINPVKIVIDQTVPAGSCSGGVCRCQPGSDLSLGRYRFRVSASEGGTSAYSPWRSFDILVVIHFPLVIR